MVKRRGPRTKYLRWIVAAVLTINPICSPLGLAGNGYLYKQNQELDTDSRYNAYNKSFEATEVFSKYMNDPVIEELWHIRQGDLLQSLPDQVLDAYFHNHPLFSQLYYMLEKNQGAMLEPFIMSQRQAVRLITANSDSESLKVRRLVIDVAKRMGFSPEAINNMTLFMQIGGSANAFTVSGSIDHIVVSINLEMVHQMHRAQLEAVVAHELHHIAFGHLIKDTLVDIMFAVMLESLTQMKSGYSMPSSEYIIRDTHRNSLRGGQQGVHRLANRSGVSAAERAKSHRARSLSAILDQAEWLRPTAKSSVNQKGLMSTRVQRVQNAKMISQWLKSTLPDVREDLNNDVFDTIIELEEKERRDLIVQFIGILQRGLHAAGPEVRPEVFDYLNSIEASLMTDAKHSPHFDPEEMLAFFAEIANTHSRWAEISCDMGAASLEQSLVVASAMSLLVLGDYSTNPLDRFRSVKNAQEAYKANQKTFLENPQVLAELVEGTDHPDINMRINTIMEAFPSYPLILFANNFMRLLLLEDVLAKAASEPARIWYNLQMRKLFDEQNDPGESEAKVEEEKNTGSGVRLRGKDKSGERAKKRLIAKINQNRESVQTDIIRLILDLEKRLEVKGSRNVRLDNFFQFHAARVQYLLENYGELKQGLDQMAGLDDQKSKDVSAQIKERLDEYVKELSETNETVQKLKAAYMEHPNVTGVWEFNAAQRLKLFKKFESLKFDLDHLDKTVLKVGQFQLAVTPNVKVDGVTHEDGSPIYYRSRIPAQLVGPVMAPAPTPEAPPDPEPISNVAVGPSSGSTPTPSAAYCRKALVKSANLIESANQVSKSSLAENNKLLN